MVSEEAIQRQVEKRARKKLDRKNRALYLAVKNIINNGMNPDSLDFQYIVFNHNNPAWQPAINTPDYSEIERIEMRDRLHEYLDKFMDAAFKTPENDTRLLVFPVDREYLRNRPRFIDITNIIPDFLN